MIVYTVASKESSDLILEYAILKGLVDLFFGKEKVYEAISKPELFVKLYNSVSPKKYRF